VLRLPVQQASPESQAALVIIEYVNFYDCLIYVCLSVFVLCLVPVLVMSTYLPVFLCHYVCT
jgi:hypothetical protein